ncbi:MAG: DMT family transporter [Dehalococcoidia bacterium]|nr:DMT family transporter [Dehalococcoidia bacterium]
MAVGMGLLAALFLALAAVMQHRAAAESPPQMALDPRLLTQLLRRKKWLVGILAMAAGYAFQALALGSGSIVVVEPILVVSLLIGLGLSALWSREALTRRDWVAACSAAAGIAAFLLLADPSGGDDRPGLGSWGLPLSVIGGCILVAVVIGLVRGHVLRAIGLATAGGLAFGLTDALTKSTVTVLTSSPAEAVTRWELYTVLGVGFAGFWLVQHAYHAGHIASSLPAVTVLEPLAGSLLGIFIFRERIRLDGPYPYLEALAALVAIVSVVVLARSPLVTGSANAGTRPAPAT